MVMNWSVSEAKAKLSALLVRARRTPQVIESRGEEIAVVISMDTYNRLRAEAEAPKETPMQAWLRSLERLKEGEDLSIELPARTLSQERPAPLLGE
jgi:prevent-host-death family protein